MSSNYDASFIKVLEWLEPVRQRPWMYIWSTDSRWLHHMVYEIVDNAVDEALAWFCKNITVIIWKDKYITVYDDGRWIPVDIHPKTGRPALETILTVLHAGWKFEKGAYKVSWWLHGVWASVVNALSSHMVATIHKDWKVYQQEYRRWIVQWDLIELGETDKSWSIIKFLADETIFETLEYSYSTLSARLKHGAYLTPWVTFTILDERTWETERFYYEWGIKTWLSNLVGEQKILSPIYFISKEGKDVLAEISLQFVNSTNSNLLSFVNNITTNDGWTHVIGFKNAMLKVVNEMSETLWETDKKIWEYQIWDVMDWLYTIISVKIPEPQFEWQTKWRLWNSYVKKEVEQIVYEALKQIFTEEPEKFKAILEKVKLSAKARLAAKLARETVLRKNALFGGVLPGKLADCRHKSKDNAELFIVEGDSAGGSAKQWRDSLFQAILPLRGKILNTEQAALQRIMENNEIKSLITAIWCWIKESYEEDKLRYNKIIIMTDADVDGAHIRTLLLTFFFRYMRPMIQNWHLFIAVSPLYKITQWKNQYYIYPDEWDLNSAVSKLWLRDAKYEVQRYKGLGEMNAEQLWETTMDPDNRKLIQVNIEDAEAADRLFRILMGEDVGARKHFILTHAKNVSELDL